MAESGDEPSSTTLAIPAPQEDLSLDYANTLSWRGGAAPREKLADFSTLLGWLARSARLPQTALDQVLEWSRRHQQEAPVLFAEAIGLREAIYRTFATLAEGCPAPEGDLAALNNALRGAPPRASLIRCEGRYCWTAEPPCPCIPALLCPVLWSAADLLAHSHRLRVRRCANDQCLWLFIDRSKAGTRRWCDMAGCGNRAKSRRHYLRSKLG